MNRFSLKIPGIGAGGLYFYIHFVTEVICFYTLSRLKGDSAFLWFAPLMYDALAFAPQAVFGRLSDRFPKFNPAVPGLVLMSFASLAFETGLLPGKYTAIIILCIGNAFVHVNGAEATLRSSGGKLSPSAIFVSGGSFGVITGKLLANTPIAFWVIIMLTLTGVPFALLAQYYRRNASCFESSCAGFNYHSTAIPPFAVIVIAVAIVAVRGYMGYGIPTSWNKTTFQTVMLYVTMGVGKALGGVLSDLFGVKKTALVSAAAALPFLLCGNEHMLVSLVGVMLFSMTMSITLALLVSVLKSSPGLAFGMTTIGLFLGTAPIFFFKFTTPASNCILISLLTVLCLAGMIFAIGNDNKEMIENV